MQGIYVITQISTNMKYVGKSKNVCKRITEHFNINAKRKSEIQKAIVKYGATDFIVELRGFPHLSGNELVDLEYETIKLEESLIPNGFNQICRGSCRDNYIVTAETRKKLSQAALGKTPSDETRRKLSRPISEEHRANMSIPKKNAIQYEFHNSKSNESFHGTSRLFCDAFGFNSKSVRANFSGHGSYRNWTRKAPTTEQ